jgi:phage terminase large subunit
MPIIKELYQPREYQIPIIKAFDNGFKRIVQIWHRRAGKDLTTLNLVIGEMVQRVGNYYYFYPTYGQGRKALWDNKTKDGKSYLSFFPKQLIKRQNNHEMKIELTNGSLFQIIGLENVDNVMGPNPRGCVFSEYSLLNPRAWDLIRPILAANGGWAIFNYTPRGKNHGYKLYETNKDNPKWYCEILRADQTGAIKDEDIDEERRAGMTEDMIQQEFYCSFISAIQGSYYWEQVDRAEKGNQFRDIPYDPKMLVHTVWDLGKNDYNCIGFYQSDGVTVRKIDYLAGGRKGLLDWIKLVREKPYLYGKHFAPHDIEVSDYTLNGDQTRREFAKEHHFDFEVVPNVPIQDGIDAGRRFFSKLYVDQTKCAEWIDAIPQYTKIYDEENKTFKDKPLHDWTSNFADEHRYASLVHHLFDNGADRKLSREIAENRIESTREAQKDAGL